MAAEKRPGFFRRIWQKAGRWAPLLVVGVLAVLFGGSALALKFTSTPGFCNSCHQMNDEYASWQASTHAAGATCIECHSDPGLLGELKAHLEGARFIYYAIANVHIEKTPVISNAVCAKCHVPEKLPDTVNGVKVNHQKHLAEGTSCQTCHGGVVHKAEENASKSADQRFHTTCQTCHESKQVAIAVSSSTSCTACHADLSKVKPQDHGSDWMSHHGEAVGSQNCAQCHVATKVGTPGDMSKPASFPSSQGTDACTDCHKTDMPHPQSFFAQHGQAADKQGAATCAVCHGPGTKANPNSPHASANFCADCHRGVTMPHAENFITQHGQQAEKLGTAACATCHSPANKANPNAKYASASFCSDCHQGLTMPHQQNFLARHGQEAVSLGNAACATCHSPANKANPNAPYASATFCTDCHKGFTMPHPANYLSNHGKIAGAEDNRSCKACHSGANPVRPLPASAANDFCTKCHAGVAMPHDQQFASEHGQQALRLGVACQTCHSPSNVANPTAPHASPGYCVDCHDRFKHPAGWVAKHGTQVNASCATCHSEVKGGRNSCLNCHPGKPGDKSLPWHPDPYWFIKHAKVAEDTGEASCAKCHAYIQPSCSKCHRNR